MASAVVEDIRRQVARDRYPLLVRPRRDNVVIRVLDETLRSRGGLHLVEQERSLQGVIVDVGPDCRDVEDGAIALGDRVLFDDNGCPWFRGPAPSWIEVLVSEDPEHVVVPERQIYGVLTNGGD